MATAVLRQLLLTEVLENFGEVVTVDKLRTKHANCVTYDGVREVRLRMNELHKQKIPHIVHLPSGQTILITMQGRPPFCLKCKSVGHVHRNAPRINMQMLFLVILLTLLLVRHRPLQRQPLSSRTESSDLGRHSPTTGIKLLPRGPRCRKRSRIFLTRLMDV